MCQNAVAVTLPGQESVTEQEGAVDQVLAFYRAGKTQRVIGELESCYLKPPKSGLRAGWKQGRDWRKPRIAMWG
jgi:hypothetical protein